MEAIAVNTTDYKSRIIVAKTKSEEAPRILFQNDSLFNEGEPTKSVLLWFNTVTYNGVKYLDKGSNNPNEITEIEVNKTDYEKAEQFINDINQLWSTLDTLQVSKLNTSNYKLIHTEKGEISRPNAKIDSAIIPISTYTRRFRIDRKLYTHKIKDHELNYNIYKDFKNREKMKALIWHRLKDFSIPRVFMQSEEYKVWIDQSKQNTYRMALWHNTQSFNEKPLLILNNGIADFQGSGGNVDYIFTHEKEQKKYSIFDNKLGKYYHDAELTITKEGKVTDFQVAEFISPIKGLH